MATPKQKASQDAFKAMLAGKKGKSAKQADPTKPFPAPKTKGTAPKGKKPMAKVDMMLMKAMPGIGMPPKKAVKKASSFPKGTTKVLTAGTAYAVGKTRTKKVAKKKVGKK